MNIVTLSGRLTRNPDVKYTQANPSMCIARYTLAVPRIGKEDQNADFINCIAFGKNAVFAEKYLKQGIKLFIRGRIQTGSFTDREGKKRYTTDVIIDEQEFAESKNANSGNNSAPDSGYTQQTFNAKPEPQQAQIDNDGFMRVPEGIESELPFL